MGVENSPKTIYVTLIEPLRLQAATIDTKSGSPLSEVYGHVRAITALLAFCYAQVVGSNASGAPALE